MHGISYPALMLMIDGLPQHDDGERRKKEQPQGKPVPFDKWREQGYVKFGD